MSSNANAAVLDCSVMKADSATTDNLRAHYLFAGLEQNDFDALMQRVGVVKIEKGKVLFQQGDKAEYFYYVDKGQLELNFVAPTG